MCTCVLLQCQVSRTLRLWCCDPESILSLVDIPPQLHSGACAVCGSLQQDVEPVSSMV